LSDDRARFDRVHYLPTFRLLGLPVRRRLRPSPADPTIVTRALVESAQLGADVLLARLESTAEGLTNHEAARRYQASGPNSIADTEHRGPWRQLLPLLASPLSLLLLALAVLTWFTGGREGAVVIAAMVVLSSLFSFVQEYRSGKAANALRSLVHTKVSLRRRMREEDGTLPATGHPVHVPLAHIVPGDIVQLSAGNLVPADVRVIAANDLFVNEAALTGESLPIEKLAAPIVNAPAPLGARNLAFMGTYVASGTATAVVVATGRSTYFGAIVRAADAPQPMTSFDVGIHRYLWLIIRFMFVMVPAVLLERHVDIFGHESRRGLEFACLNSFFQSGLRNLLDEAVLTHAELHSDVRSGLGYVKIDEILFDFERRRMSVVVGTADDSKHFLICKGAVEEIIAVCERAASLSADAAGADSCQQPALRRVADGAHHGRRRCRLSRSAVALGHQRYRLLPGLHRAAVVAVRLRDVRRFGLD
jgi:magnesium-transporting ATPase (P-type)